MKHVVPLAIISACLLALFLCLRPVLGTLGAPTVPTVEGHARQPVDDGTGALPPATAPTMSAAPPAMTTKPTPADAARLGITHPDPLEQRIFELTNAERQREGKPSLAADDDLRQAARGHSDDMLARGFFDHTNPDGQESADRIAVEHRRLIGLTGENIFKIQGGDFSNVDQIARQVMAGWMKSTGHRANILSPEYTHLGVGVSIKSGELQATQNFAAARAFLEQQVPPQVQSGGNLNLAAKPVGNVAQPEKYGFFVPNKGTNPVTYPLNDGTVKVGAGVYKLWFYFPKPGGYTIYYGPQIEVK